jgi:hypothetical protein
MAGMRGFHRCNATGGIDHRLDWLARAGNSNARRTDGKCRNVKHSPNP